MTLVPQPVQIFMQVLAWNTGQFEFGAQEVACDDQLGSATMTSLLLEHARQMDEQNREPA
jgi:hypothetical protein